jgi:hypothetical protein
MRDTGELSPEALKVIDLVEKLFALGRNNDNEHQAAEAIRKGMALLVDYNLDITLVGANAKGSVRKDKQRKGGLYQWQRNLWGAVAKLNFCLYREQKGLKKGEQYQHRLIGRHENVISTEVMADYLQQTIERLAQDHARYMGWKSCFVRDAIAYREGMADRLTSRIHDLRRQRLEEDKRKEREAAAANRHPGSAPGTALVLASVINDEEDLNQDYLDGLPPGTHAQQRAEREARRAAIRAEAEAALETREAKELADPRLKAHRLAIEANREAEWEARQEENRRLEEKRAKRWKTGSSRPRAKSPAEKRADLDGYWDGHEKGGTIGLDQQLDEETRRRLG